MIIVVNKHNFINGNIMKDFIQYIKKYSTKKFIYTFAEISIEIYKNQIRQHSKSEIPGTVQFLLRVKEYGFITKIVQVMLSAWEIPDMAYVSITNANDYRNKNVLIGELGIIVNLYRGYENNKSEIEYLRNADFSDISKYLFGITYEQFKYENMWWTIQSFNRIYHILVGSSNICRNKILDINKITYEIFGMNVDELLVTELIILWICSIHPNPLDAPEELYNKKSGSILTRENIKRIIKYYSINYKEVRNSKIGKQIFYSKPFVHTQEGDEYIMVSLYLVQMVFADGLYWLIRDYYLNKKMGQAFINAFGNMFEEYFKELALQYLPKDCCHKISEGQKKSADFCIEFENAVFLFELKSGLMGIGAKQQTPDIKQINSFIKRNIMEAYEQLKSSENNYQGDKPIIKIFLLYEYFDNSQMMMTAMPEIFGENDRYYIMSIQDFEILLCTYKNDVQKFNKIIEMMLESNYNKSHNKSVLHILNEQGVLTYIHFEGKNNYLKKIFSMLKTEFE